MRSHMQQNKAEHPSQEQHSQTMGMILAAATMSMPMATTRISRSCMFLVWVVSESEAGSAQNDLAASPADPSHSQAAEVARAAFVAKIVLQLATCKHDLADPTGASH